MTALTRQQYGNNQIMSVTGHKSVSSLAIYQCTSNSSNAAVPVSNSPTYIPHTYVASSHPHLTALDIAFCNRMLLLAQGLSAGWLQ